MFRLTTRTVFQPFRPAKCQSRSLWEWVNMMFNKPDFDRLKEVGPDRCCAEWLLRNGGAVRWTGDAAIQTDYNSLPLNTSGRFVEEIDGTDSSISHYGFRHLSGCKHIKRIILHKCSYLNDEALKALAFVDSPLNYLQISDCRNITDNGLKQIPPLNDLKTLVLFRLESVNNMAECESHLRKLLPGCNIETAEKTDEKTHVKS